MAKDQGFNVNEKRPARPESFGPDRADQNQQGMRLPDGQPVGCR
jgi:hypothetical protein